MDAKNNLKSRELRQGVMVFLTLAVLTAIEYVIGVNEIGVVFLWIIALIKAASVIWFFMHVFRVINPDEGEHS
jgi:heme/copper-type cytochrome/quinol oxidase subunit 4